MKQEPPSSAVHETLHAAAKVYSRHRALLMLLRAAVWLAIAIPVVLLADVLMHFSDTIRLGSALGWIVAVLATIGVAVAIAFFSRPPLLRIARLLESRDPSLGSKLVNILQLEAEASSEGSAPLTRELARQAVNDAGKAIDLTTLPPKAREPRLKRQLLRTLVPACAIVLLTWFGGVHVRQQWLRFVDPYGDHPPFSLTHLEIATPKEGAKVLYDGATSVEVRASGHLPHDLFLSAQGPDHNKPPLVLPMASRGDGTFVVRLEHIREPLVLTAHTGDRETLSQHHNLGVILTPQLGEAVVRITPPAYTGQHPREMPYKFTALQILEGSSVEFKIHSNRPLGAGKVLFESDQAPAVIPLAPATEGPAEVGVASFVAERSVRATFTLIDADGNMAADTPSASLTVTRDQPPGIEIAQPADDAIVAEGTPVQVMVDATDDYGLRSVRLHIGLNGDYKPVDPVNFDAPDTRRHRLEHALNFAQLGAKPGDKVTMFAEAVDTRPDPQISRTTIRTLEVISEEDYNNRLREKADVAMIAGKYERLLKRLEQQIAEQRAIEEKLAQLRKEAEKGPLGEKQISEFAEAVAKQEELNGRLQQLAADMQEFGRDKPVYDFEKELQEKLREEAKNLRESAKTNEADAQQALAAGPQPPEPPNQAMMEGMEKAAREQKERLQGGSDKAGKEVLEPLEDLAKLHELMKDFKRFEQLAKEQRELAEQAKAYENKPNLDAADRLALRDLGAKQREMAPKLEQLQRKLKNDAEAAKEEFPEAAQSAEELAEQMDAGGMGELAREAAQNMLDGKGKDAGAQAGNLRDAMDRLFEDAGQQGQQNAAQGLDHALRLMRGMNPGNSLEQMLRSKNFRPLPSEGKGGTGEGGEMADSTMDGEPMLLGGESLMDGPIAEMLAGRGSEGGNGQPGGPTAKIDRAHNAETDEQSSRRTNTPGGSALLLEYESVADAYFRKLTTKP